MRRILLVLLTLDFTVLTGYALEQHGYWGIIAPLLSSSAGWQVMADLTISCMVAAGWMFADARRNGRNPWPYLLLTLVLGSFGPLCYLLLERRNEARSAKPVLQTGAA